MAVALVIIAALIFVARLTYWVMRIRQDAKGRRWRRSPAAGGVRMTMPAEDEVRSAVRWLLSVGWQVRPNPILHKVRAVQLSLIYAVKASSTSTS